MFFNCKLPVDWGYVFSRNNTTELGLTQLPLSLDRGLKSIWLCFYYTQLLFCLTKVFLSSLCTDFQHSKSGRRRTNIQSTNFSSVQVAFNCKMPAGRGYVFSRNHPTELNLFQLLLSLDRSLKLIWYLFFVFNLSFALQRPMCYGFERNAFQPRALETAHASGQYIAT